MNEEEIITHTTRHMVELSSQSNEAMNAFHNAWQEMNLEDRTGWGVDQAVEFFQEIIEIIKRDPGSIMTVVFGVVQSNSENPSPRFHASISGDPSIAFLAGNALMQNIVGRLKEKVQLSAQETKPTQH
jgi:hypothetical protein